jgi:hypothetical protein
MFDNTVHLAPSEHNISAVEKSLLEQHEVRVEYHPRSKVHPDNFSFYEYSSLAKDGIHKVEDNSQNEPWHPFNSRLDFELAELILETHLNKDQTNSLLSLIKRCVKDPSSFTLENSKQLEATWDACKAKTTSVSSTFSNDIFNTLTY